MSRMYSVVCYKKQIPVSFQDPKIVYVKANTSKEAREQVEFFRRDLIVDVVICGYLSS